MQLAGRTGESVRRRAISFTARLLEVLYPPPPAQLAQGARIGKLSKHSQSVRISSLMDADLVPTGDQLHLGV